MNNIDRNTEMDRWTGRVALVTGASSGNGAAISEALVKAGMTVVGADKDEKLDDTKGSLKIFKCDVTKDEDVYDLFKKIKELYGGVDICVNNVGMSFNKSLLDGSPDEWRQMMNVNVISHCLCTKLAVASMRERGVDDGHIINMSSVAAHRMADHPEMNFYSVTKNAVRAITEGLRQELRAAKSHIRVSSISPGVVKTNFASNAKYDPRAVKAFYAAIECLNAEDIARTILHMIASPPHVEINDVIIRPTEQVL